MADDSLASLNGSLVLTTTATSISPVGQYVIIPSGVSSDNYDITFVNGILTVQSPEQMKEAIASAEHYIDLSLDGGFKNNEALLDPLISIVDNGVNPGELTLLSTDGLDSNEEAE